MATSILIILYTTVKFFELSNVNAQYSIGELDVLNNQGVGMLIQVTLLKL